jgi:hypothetical protein
MRRLAPKRTEKVSKNPWAIACIIVEVSCLLRVLVDNRSLFEHRLGSEAMNVADSFAYTGSFADAYFPGQGPTAHLTPIMPFLAGTLIRLMGNHERATQLLLLAFSLSQVAAAYLIGFAICKRRFGTATAILGLLVLAIPVFPMAETTLFRYWDGAAAAILAGLLFLIVDADRPLTHRRTLSAGLLLGVLIFLNQIIGLGVVAAVTVALIRRQFRSLFLLACVTTVTVAAFVGPWAFRNERELGRAIPFRSNLNLELSMGFYQGAIKPTDPRREFAARIADVHPLMSRTSQMRIRQIGEVRFFDELGQTTRAWIADHPGEALRLALRHWVSFFAPSLWSFDRDDYRSIQRLGSIVLPAIMLLGLLSTILNAGRFRLARMTLTFTMCCSILYVISQPVPRYSYPVYVQLVFWAVVLIMSLLRKWKRTLASKARFISRSEVAKI